MGRSVSITVLCGLAALAACDSAPSPGNAGAAADSATAVGNGAAAAPAASAVLAGDTADRVKKIVVDELEVDPARVTAEASLMRDLGADSLDVVELVLGIEEEFGVKIPDVAAEKLVTVGDFIAYVEDNPCRPGMDCD